MVYILRLKRTEVGQLIATQWKTADSLINVDDQAAVSCTCQCKKCGVKL